MTSPIKTFQTKLSDEYDEYPEAFVAIYKLSITKQVEIESADFKSDYEEGDSDVQGVAYKAVFWNSPQAKANGKRSRPLYHENENGRTDVFIADLDHSEAIQIKNSELTGYEKDLHIARRDLTRRFQ